MSKSSRDAEVLRDNPTCELCGEPSSVVARPVRGVTFAWCSRCAERRRPRASKLMLFVPAIKREMWVDTQRREATRLRDRPLG